VTPVDPGPSRWQFDLSGATEGDDFLGIGADLEPATVLAAYRAGAFPMPVTGLRRTRLTSSVGWWSPDPRGVLPLAGLRVSRSLRQSVRRFELRLDTAFDTVITACADPARDGGWIRRDVKAAYLRLHELGWAHSVEAWSVAADGTERLSGGLYGLSVGGLFAGESMFHGPLHEDRDASKVALVGLVELLLAAGDAADRLLDVQWATEHLVSLGTVEVPRPDYLALLGRALELPDPFAVTDGSR
jgi:leucyl/phenylalanyl-tRNA---protein transferase